MPLGVVMQHHAAGAACDEFLVGAVRDEFGVDDILRAGVGDPIVDDDDLAMVAQVKARDVATKNPHRQHRANRDAAKAQVGCKALQSAP